jgi:glutamate racemase
VKAIVIACNSASSVAFDVVKEEIDIPVIEVIKPGARAAAKNTKNGKIGIIGTETTINSRIYTKYLKEIHAGVKVFSKACPLFVPLVEENWLYDSVTVEVAGRYMSEIIGYGVDTCVLGCTHYPLLRHTLRKVLGEGVTLVNPAYETALELERVLTEKNILGDEQVTGHKIYVSDKAETFKAFANTILPFEVEEISDINIEKY